MSVRFLTDKNSTPHQMLVTDADGKVKWEERTHYTYTDVTDILSETTVTVDSESMEAPISKSLYEYIAVGAEYTVTYNGVEYTCTAQPFDVDGIVVTTLGNLGAMTGGDDTGEPFIVIAFPPEVAAEMPYPSGMYVLDSSSTVTLKISGVGEIVHPIDRKYFAGSIKGQKTINVYLVDDTSATCDVTFDEAWAMEDGELQNALLIHSSSGDTTFAAFGVGKFCSNGGIYDIIQFSFQVPTDCARVVTTYVYDWYGHLQGDPTHPGIIGKSFMHYSLPEGTQGTNSFLVSNGSGWNIVDAMTFTDYLRPTRYPLYSDNTQWAKKYTFKLDAEGNIGIYEPDSSVSAGIKLVDTIAKASDLAAIGGSSSTEVPAYVRTEAETVARLVNQHQSNDSIVFPFLADAHCGYYTDTTNAATTLAGQLLDLIGQRVPYDFIVHDGDMANGAWDTTRDMSYEQIEDYTELTSDANRGIPAIWVPGNHDDSPYMATADRVTQKEMYALIGRKNRSSGAICPNGCNYGYLDLESQHLRVIYLDTDDKRSWGTVQVGNGETAPAYLNAHNVGGDQLRWLANTALDFSDKDNAADWNIVVVSHVALDVSGTITDAVSGTSYAYSTANAATVLSDYATGGSGSVTHNDVTVPYDFSTLDARASVICCVHGHGHKFCDETVGGILSIGCPNVMNGRERESSDGNTYTKTADTADGTSFCILTIDRENQLIYADCVGVGPDREFTYTTEVVAYTNLLPISTDASGAVYNGKGYKEDTYLSSGNDGTKTGIYASGYIQGVPNEYGNYFFYLKNVGMQTGQDSHRVALYDSTKTYITTVKTTVTGNPFTYGDDGNISQLMFTGTSYPDGLYIRICCGYLGDDSIITANEPIE